MRRKTIRRYSIFCILPSRRLRAIAQHGTSRQRAWAMGTLVTGTTFRALRAVPQPAVLATARRLRAILAEGGKQRTTYDAHKIENLPGDVVRAEGAPPTGDMVIDEAYNGLGATYAFFWEVYARNSIDDEGLPLAGTVYFGADYDNAV
jgi:hypothetical protein